jgi:hypothetical protein
MIQAELRSTLSFFIVGIFAAAGFVACAAPSKAGPQDSGPSDADRVSLFDGKTLAGWRGLIELPKRLALKPDDLTQFQATADASMRLHWTAQDGTLVFDGKGDSIVSAKDYQDFELWLDWKIEKGGDSGVYLRGTPQVQIWDNPEGSGALWNNKRNPNKPLAVADNPVGEWNNFYIKMVGERVTVRLNDKLVVDNTVLENYWDPSKPVYDSGPIELQNHGNKLYFRNIYIRELPRKQ